MHLGLIQVFYLAQIHIHHRALWIGWISDHTLRAHTDKEEKRESHLQTQSFAMLSGFTVCASTRTMIEKHLFIKLLLSLTNFRVCFRFALIGQLCSQASYGHIEGTNFMACFQNALLKKNYCGLCQCFRVINNQSTTNG